MYTQGFCWCGPFQHLIYTGVHLAVPTVRNAASCLIARRVEKESDAGTGTGGRERCHPAQDAFFLSRCQWTSRQPGTQLLVTMEVFPRQGDPSTQSFFLTYISHCGKVEAPTHTHFSLARGLASWEQKQPGNFLSAPVPGKPGFRKRTPNGITQLGTGRHPKNKSFPGTPQEAERWGR